jgi:transposase-like protein
MALSKHCIQCGELHDGRSNYCCDECERTFNNKKRAERAGKKCRLCGRKYRKPRTHVTEGINDCQAISCD